MEAAPEAIPVKPNTPAISAIIRKRNDQRNITFDLSEQYLSQEKNMPIKPY